MRILFITYSIKEEAGVGSARSRMLYDMLRDKGHDITLLSDGMYSLKNIFYYIVFRQYDKVYFSGPPYSYYLIMLLVAVSLRKVNLIVDFRDAWSLNVKNGYGTGICRNKIKLKCIEYIERILYHKSYKFVVCTEGMYERYGNLLNDFKKVVLVENGHEYELADLKKEKNITVSSNIFICIGQLFSYNFHKSIEIIKEINEFAVNNDIKVIFIGTDKLTQKYLIDNKFNINFKVEFLGRVNYEKLKLFIKKADVGLLIIRDESIDYGTKVFDYIGLGVPLFSKFDCENNFYKRFKDYIINDLNNIPKIKPDYEMKFSRRKQLEKLVEYIEE